MRRLTPNKLKLIGSISNNDDQDNNNNKNKLNVRNNGCATVDPVQDGGEKEKLSPLFSNPSNISSWVEPLEIDENEEAHGGVEDEGDQSNLTTINNDLGRREKKRRKRRSVFHAIQQPIDSGKFFHSLQLPAYRWIKRYDVKRNLLWDLQAGLVVGVLLIPQGMAYGELAHLSPIYGLYCAIVPNIVYAMLGTSRESAVGAMALVSIMVGEILTAYTSEHASLQEKVDVAVKLNFLTGIIQVLLGLLKMGEIANYVSHPVMQGFSSGGEILIAISQLKYLFGIKVPSYKYAYQTLGHLGKHIGDTQVWTLLLGLSTFAVLFAISRWRKKEKERIEKMNRRGSREEISRLKRYLMLLVNFGPFFSILITAFIAFEMDKCGVPPAVIGKVPSGLHFFQACNMRVDDLQGLISSAFLLGLISFMLTFSVSKKYASMAKYELDYNQELFALGAADALGSFFGAFPVAGGFARTAVNVEAGAKTQLSSLVSASIILLAVNFLTKFFYWIPQCTLAAIVNVAICNVVDFRPFLYAFRASKGEFVVMMLTFVITLALGVDKGIIVGVALSMINLVRRTSHPHIKVLGCVPNTGKHYVFRDVTRFVHAVQPPDAVIIRIDESFNFASCQSIKEQILKLAADPSSCFDKMASKRKRGKKLRSWPSPSSLRNNDLSNSVGDNQDSPMEEGVLPLSDQHSVLSQGSDIPHKPPMKVRSRSTHTKGKKKPSYVILCFSGVNHIDLSGIRTLDEIHQALDRDFQVLYITNVKSKIRDKIRGTPIWDILGGDLIFLSLPALLDHIIEDKSWIGDKEKCPLTIPDYNSDCCEYVI